MSPKTEMRLGVRYDSMRTTDIAAGVPPGDKLDYRNIVPTLSVLLDGRDSRANPTRGVLFRGSFDASLDAFSIPLGFNNDSLLLALAQCPHRPSVGESAHHPNGDPTDVFLFFSSEATMANVTANGAGNVMLTPIISASVGSGS